MLLSGVSLIKTILIFTLHRTTFFIYENEYYLRKRFSAFIPLLMLVILMHEPPTHAITLTLNFLYTKIHSIMYSILELYT